MADATQTDTALESPDAPLATGARARIARVYAEAIVGVANATQQGEVLGDELAAFAGAIKGHPAVASFLAGNSVSKSDKLPILAATFERGTSETFRKLVGVLNANGRLSLVPAISAEYHKIRDTAAGRVRVRVTTPVALSGEQVAGLTQTLHAQLHAQPVLDVRVDPEILGGLIVQVGDKVYDTSVRSRLENLRNHLMTSGTHG